MAKKIKKKISKIKVKKKLWCKVTAPKIFGNKGIGESYLQSPEKAVGRKLKVNLRDLTGNVKDQNVRIGFQVNKVDGSVLNTSITSYELTSAYVKRLVRKNTARLDDCFVFKTKSGRKVTVKSLMIALHKTQRSVKTKLRKELHSLLQAEVSKTDLATFVSNLVNRKVQMELKRKLKKIFPLRDVAVRVLKLQEKGVAKEEVVVEDKTEEKEKSEEQKAEQEGRIPVQKERTPPPEQKEVPAEAKKREASEMKKE